jgi:hypothetical protein
MNKIGLCILVGIDLVVLNRLAYDLKVTLATGVGHLFRFR